MSINLSAWGQTKSSQHSLPLTEAIPEEVGMSSARLARIDTMCQDAIAEGQVPGLVALVARHGKIVYHKAFGLADHARARTMKRDDIFRIASQTKAVTATAVMMLWEEGRFKLDDPIAKYIPEFTDVQVLDEVLENGQYRTTPANAPITIRHLLTHTSGIGYGEIDTDDRFKKIYREAGIVDIATTEAITIEENVKRLAGLPLHHHPGEKYTYGEGLDVLGYFIEIISGHLLDTYLHKHLFEPLGMNDTWFYLPGSKHHRLVPVQTNVKGKGDWQCYPVTFYDPDYPIKGAKTYFSGGAGLSSTAKDYATFLQMYLNQGELNGIRYLSRKTIETMMCQQLPGLWKPESYYSLAFSVITEQGQSLGGKGSTGTFEWGGYFNSQYFADPQEQTIGVLLKQTRAIEKDDTGWKFNILIHQAIDD